MLASVKLQTGVTTSDIVFGMHIQLSTLNCLEKGKTNFGMRRALDYIMCLKAHLCLSNATQSIQITDYNSIIAWVKNVRGAEMSQRALAKLIGCSYVHLANIETQKSTMSIDTLLKIADLFGYNVEVQPILKMNNI